MRRILLWFASMIVGTMTFADIVALLAGHQAAVVPAIITWGTAVLIGMILSAPFFLRPPEIGDGFSMWTPPILWLVLMVMRLIWRIGFTILRGIWSLIYIAMRQRSAPDAAAASFGPNNGGAAPTNSPPPPPPMPRAMPGGVPPSWQADPTGRYQQRYWDGWTWTAHVANGTIVTMDPP